MIVAARWSACRPRRPQILSAIFLATSQHWQRNTAAYLAGAALSITLVVSLPYLLSPGAPREGGSNQTVNVIVLVLLLAAMVHVFLARKQSEPPKWMGKLQTANPRLSRFVTAVVVLTHRLGWKVPGWGCYT